MQEKGVVICEIFGSPNFDEIPKCISHVDEKTGKRVSAFLENPFPFISDEELNTITKNLIDC